MYTLENFQQMMLSEYGCDVSSCEVILENDYERYSLCNIPNMDIRKVDMIRLREDISVPKLVRDFDYDRVLRCLVATMDGVKHSCVMIVEVKDDTPFSITTDGPIFYSTHGQMLHVNETRDRIEAYYFAEGILKTEVHTLIDGMLVRSYEDPGSLTNRISIENDLYNNPVNTEECFLYPPSSFRSDNLYFMPILPSFMMVQVEGTWQWMDTKTFINNTPNKYLGEVEKLRNSYELSDLL